MKTARLPDGRTVQFPDDATPEEMTESLNSNFPVEPAQPRDTTLGEKAAGIGLGLGSGAMRTTKGIVDLASYILPDAITDPASDYFQRGIDAASGLTPEAYKDKQAQSFLERGADGSIEGMQLPSIEHVSSLVSETLPMIPFLLSGGGLATAGITKVAPKLKGLAGDALGLGAANAALIAPGQGDDTRREVLAAGGSVEEAERAEKVAAGLTALLAGTTGTLGGGVASKLGASAGSLPGAIAKGFAAEAPFEGIEEGGQSLIADYAAGRDLDINSAIDQLVSAGFLGGTPGAAIAGVRYAADGTPLPVDDVPAPEQPSAESLNLQQELNDRIDQARQTIAGQGPALQPEPVPVPESVPGPVPVQPEPKITQPEPIQEVVPEPVVEPVVAPVEELPPEANPNLKREKVDVADQEPARPRPQAPKPVPFDARRATPEERTAHQQRVKSGEVAPDPKATLRAFKNGNMAQAIELQDGTWLFRSKPDHLAKFSEWEPRESIETINMTPYSTNSGIIKVPGKGEFKVGERFETDKGMRGPPDLLQELAAGKKINRKAFAEQLGMDIADTKNIRPIPGKFDSPFSDKDGMTPDDLLEWMKENGYINEESEVKPDEATIHDAYEILSDALSGGRVVSSYYSEKESAYQADLQAAEEQARQEFDDETEAKEYEDAMMAGYEAGPDFTDADIELFADERFEKEVTNVEQGETPGGVSQGSGTEAPARTAEPAAAAEPAAREPQATEQATEQPELIEPAPTPEPNAEPEQIVTSTKNEVVEGERESRGAEQILSEARISNPETVDEALKTLKDNPAAAEEITSRLNNRLSDEISVLDEAVMLVRKVQLMTERKKLAARASDESLTEDQRLVAKNKWAETEVEIETIDQATRRSGSIWGRFGQFRARLLREDFSFEAMENKARAVRNRPLTIEESNELKAQAEKIAELTERQAKLEQEIQDLKHKAESDRITAELAKKFTDSKLQVPKSNKAWLEAVNKKADESRAWLKENLSKVNDISSVPQAWFHLVRIGASHIANGTVKLADWVKVMRADLGERVFKAMESEAEAIFNESKLQAESDAIDANQAIPMQAEAFYKPTAAETIVLDAATDAAAGLDLTHKAVYELAKAHIQQGLRGEEAVMSAVHSDLEPFFPGLTERDVRRLYSEYGKVKYPSKEADKVMLRELRELVRLQESIDRLIERQAPLKTGLQRDKPTKKVRDKQRLLNAKLAEFERQYPSTSPDRLASVNDARMTRLKNQIADLEAELKTGQKPVKGKTVDPTPEVIEKMKMRDALKEKLRLIEEAKNPPPTAEEKYQASRNKQLKRQLAEVQSRLKNNDYAKVKRPDPKPLNEENKKLQYELAQEKAKFIMAQYNWELEQAGKVRKAFRFVGRVLSFSRSVKTSFDLSAFLRQGGLPIFAHPKLLAGKTMGAQLRSLKSDAEAFALNKQIFDHPKTDFALKAGLFLSDNNYTKPTQREEAFMDEWVKRTPGVAASARAYMVGLNMVRITYFNYLVENLGRGGTVTEEEAKHLAYWVNRATGRGSLANFGDTGGTTVFFAPRWVQSRFSVLSGYPVWSAPTRRLKKQIALEYGRSMLGFTTLLAIISGAFALDGDEEDKPTVSFDPKSTDFMKIKVGETRIDMTAAMASPIVFLTRVLGGEKTTQSGDVVPLRGEDVPYGGDDVWDIINRFLRSKLAPPVAASINLAVGENVVGEESTAAGEFAGLFMPLSLSDTLAAMEAQGIPKGSAITLLSIIGAASNTYAQREAEKDDEKTPRRPKTRVPVERVRREKKPD